VQIAASFASKDDRKIDHHNSRYRGNNRDEPSSSRQAYKSRSRFEPQLEITEEQMLNAPCTMHYYIDDEGCRQSNHLMKDYMTCQRMIPVFRKTNQNAPRQGLDGVPGSVAFNTPPPPPLPPQNPLLAIQAAPASNNNPPNRHTGSRGAVNMIQKSRPNNRK
jgi:hypothetical protein